MGQRILVVAISLLSLGLGSCTLALLNEIGGSDEAAPPEACPTRPATSAGEPVEAGACSDACAPDCGR